MSIDLWLYKLILYVHIVSVVLSLGPFFVLIPLLKKLKTIPQDHLDTSLQAFTVTVTLSKHSGHVLTVSGVLLWMLGGWSWSESWILVTLAILLGSLFFIARAFSPIIRQMKSAEAERHSLVAKLSRAVVWYVIILLVMMWFMVAKPTLW